jgi:acetolactate synthase small subunit
MLLIEKSGKIERSIEIYNLDKDNEVGVAVCSGDDAALIYLTIEEVKQVIEHLQKQISKVVDTGAGFQGENNGDGLSGFRG